MEEEDGWSPSLPIFPGRVFQQDRRVKGNVSVDFSTVCCNGWRHGALADRTEGLMAQVVGCMAMSHGPQLMMPPNRWHALTAKDRREHGATLDAAPRNEPDEVKWSKWRRCMEAIDALRGKLREWEPDALILVGDDQHENLLEDAMPPFVLFR